jgi:hypothetical protein
LDGHSAKSPIVVVLQAALDSLRSCFFQVLANLCNAGEVPLRASSGFESKFVKGCGGLAQDRYVLSQDQNKFSYRRRLQLQLPGLPLGVVPEVA